MASLRNSQNQKGGTMSPWANYLTTQSLYFLICKIGTVFISQCCYENPVIYMESI